MNQKNNKIEYFLAFSGIVTALFIFMYFSGVIFSGYHIMDDEEVYSWTNDFYSQHGFFLGFWRKLLDDILEFGRFRYTWVLIRWVEIRVFGDNMLAWHIYQTLFDACTLFAIYVFIKKLSIRKVYFFLFAFLLYFGYQAQILWMLGPQENIGVFFLTLTFILWLDHIQTKNLKNTIFLYLAIFMLAGSKESFLILFPILPVFFCYFYRTRKEEISLRNFILSEWKIILWIYMIFALSIIRIITIDVGESGTVKNGKNLNNIISSVINNITNHLLAYSAAGVIAGLFVISFIFIYKKEYIHRLVMLFFMFSYVLGTQLFIYINKDMTWRYLVPTTYFLALFFVLVWNDILSKNKIVIILSALILSGLIGYGNRNTMRFAHVYAEDGNSLKRIFDVAEENIKDGDRVLILMDLEGSYATRLYLQNKNNKVEYIENKKQSIGDVDIIILSTAVDEYLYVNDEVEDDSTTNWCIYEEGMYTLFYKE